nr:ABC transporter ATP-binding protein [Corynebacterium mendelii]
MAGVSVVRSGNTVIDDVAVTIPDNGVVGLVGPNGAGKTTLLNLMYRHLSASRGTVVVDGRDIESLTRRTIAATCAVVAQEKDTALPLTVKDSVALGRLSARSVFGYGDHTDRKLVADALAEVGLDALGDRLTTQLSGGELQRVLIARAIVQNATHLLLDEPTNHLDISHQFELMNLVRAMGTTTVMVLHDLNLAARYCDSIGLVDAGRLVAFGPPDTVLTEEIIGRVYRVAVTAVTVGGRRHLVFDPIQHAAH